MDQNIGIKMENDIEQTDQQLSVQMDQNIGIKTETN
jgi:hypothetical protein